MSQLRTDLKRDLRAARKIRFPWWAGLTLAASAALCAAMFDHFKRLDLALPDMNSFVVFGYLIRLKWYLRNRIWFWATMLFCALLHVPLIMAIPWTTKWVLPGAVAIIDAVDFCVILVLLAVFEKIVSDNRRPDDHQHPT